MAFTHDEIAGFLIKPDWDAVKVPVECARCGSDLRGLEHSKCVDCRLEFEWSDVFPVEDFTCEACGYHLYTIDDGTCPECGESYRWGDLLRACHAKRRSLFEYRWSDRPVRSLFTTWKKCFRPGRLWAELNLHDPRASKPTLVMAGLFLFMTIPLSWFAIAAVELLDGWIWSPGWNPSIFEQLYRAFSSPFGSTHYWSGVFTVLCWAGLSLCGLFIFIESMAISRVRRGQVLRVWAYCVPSACTLLILVVAGLYLLLIVGSSLGQFYPRIVFYICLHHHFIKVIALVCAVVFASYSLSLGYRRYLRMRGGLAIVVLSQAVALLGAAVADIVVYLDNSSTMWLLIRCMGLQY